MVLFFVILCFTVKYLEIDSIWIIQQPSDIMLNSSQCLQSWGLTLPDRCDSWAKYLPSYPIGNLLRDTLHSRYFRGNLLTVVSEWPKYNEILFNSVLLGHRRLLRNGLKHLIYDTLCQNNTVLYKTKNIVFYNTKRTTIWSETSVLDPTKNIFRKIVLLYFDLSSWH